VDADKIANLAQHPKSLGTAALQYRKYFQQTFMGQKGSRVTVYFRLMKQTS